MADCRRTTTTTSLAATPSVTWSGGEIRLRDERVFGRDVLDSAPCARFLGRILALDEVRGVTVDRDEATAILGIGLNIGSGSADASGFLSRLAGAIRGEGAAGLAPGWAIPSARWERGTRFSVSRHGGLYSMWGVVYDRPGRLRLRHDALALNPDLGRRVAREIAMTAASCRASASAWTGSLAIDYDPALLSASELIRIAEEALERASVSMAVAEVGDERAGREIGFAADSPSSDLTATFSREHAREGLERSGGEGNFDQPPIGAHPRTTSPEPTTEGLPSSPVVEPSPPAGPSENLELAGAVLGVAALGQFAVPALIPVSAALLVGTNLRTFSAAWRQARERKLGLPVLSTSIVATTLASGQFVGAALMSCFTAYWNRRGRRDLAEHTQKVLDDCVPSAPLVRLLSGAVEGEESGTTDILIAPDQLHVGNHVRVEAGEAIPADGRIRDGWLVVDEQSLLGLDGASRKGPGDFVLAGSIVLTGSASVIVKRTGESTRGASIARAIAAGVAPVRGRSAPSRFAEEFATRTVGPVLAVSGAGLLLTGNPATALAMMRPDYATGLGISVPMASLRDVARCARRGIVVRDPEAFDKLDRAELIILDDHPALHRPALEVAGVETRMPAEVIPEVLRYAASALRHLDDTRAAALTAACREREVPLLDLEPAEITEQGIGVAIVHGRRRVRIHEADPEVEAALRLDRGHGHERKNENDDAGNRDRKRSSSKASSQRDQVATPARPLLVEIDGNLVALISFRESSRFAASEPIRRLAASRRVPIVLMTERPRAEVAAMAAALGVNQVQGSLDASARADLVRSYRLKGVRAAFVGDGASPAAAESFVTVALPESTRATSVRSSQDQAKPRSRASAHERMASMANADTTLRAPLPLPLQEGGSVSVQLLSDRLDRLEILWDVAAERARRIRRDQAIIVAPNVAAAAGALLLGFTGFHTIVLTNLGTYTAYTLANDPPEARRKSGRRFPGIGQTRQATASMTPLASREEQS